jgi:peptide/nickel transport system permease protein
MTPLLDIQNLHVVYHSRTGETIPALTDVSFDLRANEILGVLGESASGKTTLASALLGLLPPNGEITKGAVLLEGQDVRRASPRPLPVRYVHWMNSVVHGDLGFSFAYNSPVGSLLWVRARNTLLLTLTATLLAWGLALPLGTWSAATLGHLPDRALSWTTATLLVIPDLVLALGLLVFAVRSGWFPTGGIVSVGFESLSLLSKLRDILMHMTLPVLALVLSALPVLVRHVRASVSEVLNAPFMRAALGHGIPRRRLHYGYALRAAANPLISLFGFSVGALLSGSLLVEVVMSWPGLGPMLLEAILARDLYVAAR